MQPLSSLEPLTLISVIQARDFHIRQIQSCLVTCIGIPCLHDPLSLDLLLAVTPLGVEGTHSVTLLLAHDLKFLVHVPVHLLQVEDCVFMLGFFQVFDRRGAVYPF